MSEVLLRHKDLKMVQVYLCKVSDSEAIRWSALEYLRIHYLANFRFNRPGLQAA
jgi:hypothetical protein